MMLDHKLNQTCKYEEKISTNEFGESIFATEILLKCRKESKEFSKLEKNSAEKVCKKIFYLREKIILGSKLDGFLISEVNELTSIVGEFTGLEVICL